MVYLDQKGGKTALQELTPKNSFTKAASPLIVSIPFTISITAVRQVRYGERCLNIYGISRQKGGKTALQELTPKNSFTKAASPLIVSIPLTISITALRQVWYGERCLNIYDISGIIIMINL